MRISNLKRCLAMAFVVLMVVGVMPFSAFSASTEFANAQLDVVVDKQSTLAPGVTLNDYTVYDKNGDQVRMFVTKADMSVDTVKLFASYKDMNPEVYGMSKLTEQVASFNQKAAAGDPYYQGTVVAGINASYYNMGNGKPTGTFVMNGIDVTTESEGNSRSFFAVLNDGSVMIGGKGEYSSYKGQIKEAIGGYYHIVKDGAVYEDGYWSKTNTQKYPRQTLGITAEGDVILMTADGNQAPSSIGLTLLEQAQVMVDLGCVEAIHLDGGGSCTYACKPEGQDEFVITNSPSDGSERSVSNGFIIVSTAVASYSFDHVVYDAENNYITPGTSVKVDISGVSSTGHAAAIPADVTYAVTNGTYADGVFTAGNVGEATITAMYNGKAVGSVALNVVVPDAVSFNSADVTVPYGKTVTIGMTATYGVKNVTIKASDFNFAFSNTAVGTLNGFDFTACEENAAVTGSNITATLVYNTALVVSSKITLGKGSDVIYNFEDGTTKDLVFAETPGTKYNYTWPDSSSWVVNEETGRVHSGNNAMAMKVNFGNSLESGYMRTCLYATEDMIFENAVKIGAWIYIPDECVGLAARWCVRPISSIAADGKVTYGNTFYGESIDDTAGDTGIVSTFEESGWHYLWVDTSAYEKVGFAKNVAMIQFYISDRDGSSYGYKADDYSNIPGNFTFYLDDVTVDYSTAVDDREAPKFDDITYAVEGMADAAVLNNQTVATGDVSLAVKVADDTTLTNATGIDNVKVYIDGVETDCVYANGIATVDVKGLDNGKHQVKFTAEDKIGNYASAFGYITVAAEDADNTVKLVPHDPDLKLPKLGSIYWMDLVADAIEEVKSVEVDIDLDSNSTWQLDHMTVANGFEATYSVVADENIATVTITRTGDVEATGEAALVSMPVRIWSLKMGYTYPNGTKQGAQAYTYAQFKSMNEYWRMSVIATIDRGVLVRTDDTVDTFSGERVFCDTEMWYIGVHKASIPGAAEYYKTWDGGHIHAAYAVADEAATCTTAGYTGRTFCDGCNSVVDWGTTVPATGHTYVVTDGVLKCECGVVFNGVFTDGKTYVDGVVLSGWVEDSYYDDGVMLTGIAAVDGVYYNFGDDGVSKGKYHGIVEVDGKYYFSRLGTLTAGWFDIDGEWYYFLPDTLEAANGSVTTEDDITFDFVDGKVQGHVWEDWYAYKRCWYGPAYYKNTAKNVKYLEVEIDGYIYCFNNAGCMQTGIVVTHESNKFDFYAYDCGTDGKAEYYTGAAEGMYFQDGFQVKGMRLVGTNEKYYFVKNTNQLATECTAELTGELTGIVYADGDVYYVENGEAIVKGLIQAADGSYYFINSSKKAVKNTWYAFSNSNGYPIKPGNYWFAEDGKMLVKNGVVHENGEVYYYENGVKVAKGLVQDTDGSYYFVNSTKKAIKNTWYAFNETSINGLPIAAGTYWFAADGKMQVKEGIYHEKNGNICYYENGYPVAKGLVQAADGSYYFINSTKKAVKNTWYAFNETSINGLPIAAGTYWFAADGKMETKDGLYLEKNGNICYYENGYPVAKGLVQAADGSYYFINSTKKAVKNTWYAFSAASTNGLDVKPGNYYFGADGKMVIA